MLKDSVTVHEAVGLLNSALEADPAAVSALVSTRVPCNELLALHPTIQAGCGPVIAGPNVGLLGVLNGLFGVDDKGYGAIEAVVEADGTVTAFRVR